MKNPLCFILLLAPIFLVACTKVEFHQKEVLSDQIMQFDSDPAEIHFYQKCRYSREGSVGGIGTSAGGGCGCY